MKTINRKTKYEIIRNIISSANPGLIRDATSSCGIEETSIKDIEERRKALLDHLDEIQTYWNDNNVDMTDRQDMIVIQATQYKQFENDNFVLYAPDSLNYITNDMEKILNNKLDEYKEIFGIDNFRKVTINYFDDLEEFRKYIIELRNGNKDSIPDYCKATFDQGMINAYIEPDLEEGSPKFFQRKDNAPHELFHIMYKELVWQKNNLKRITWFDEGMAQYFSKSKIEGLSDDFTSWFNRVRHDTKVIPNMNELEHGDMFENDNYSGYDLSLLAIKYLNDTLGSDEFKKLIYDNDRVIRLGNSIIEEAFSFYEDIEYKKIKQF